MRAGLMLVWLGAATVAGPAKPGPALAALDNEQFCKAMVEIARGAKGRRRHVDRSQYPR